MCGEIGGDAEERAAEYIAEHVSKPVVGVHRRLHCAAGQDDGSRRSDRVRLTRHRRGQGRGAREPRRPRRADADAGRRGGGVAARRRGVGSRARADDRPSRARAAGPAARQGQGRRPPLARQGQGWRRRSRARAAGRRSRARAAGPAASDDRRKPRVPAEHSAVARCSAARARKPRVSRRALCRCAVLGGKTSLPSAFVASKARLKPLVRAVRWRTSPTRSEVTWRIWIRGWPSSIASFEKSSLILRLTGPRPGACRSA